MARSKNRSRCGAATVAGGQCQNYSDSCPHDSHRRQRSTASGLPQPSMLGDTQVPVPEGASRQFSARSRPFGAAPQVPRLADDPIALSRMAAECSERLRLQESHVIKDYWLVRAVHETDLMLSGSGEMPAAMPHQPPIGRLILGGGTSLAAAWGVSQRFSEDLDFIVIPNPGSVGRRFKRAAKRFAIELSKRLGGFPRIVTQGPQHFFCELVIPGTGPVSIDIVVRETAGSPVMSQREAVASLLSRAADSGALGMFPETGGVDGFSFDVLGPCSTAMDKLLALAALSADGDLAGIRQRARDIYDLACIAKDAARFEGHIGRDSPRLLAVSQNWRRDVDGSERPDGGFASLELFDPDSPQHTALRVGYDWVQSNMVWGDRTPFGEAVDLALSLDPGPPDTHVRVSAYPRGISYPQ